MHTHTHTCARTDWLASVQRTKQIFSVGTKWALDKNKNQSLYAQIINHLSSNKHTRQYIQERRQFGHINLWIFTMVNLMVFTSVIKTMIRIQNIKPKLF